MYIYYTVHIYLYSNLDQRAPNEDFALQSRVNRKVDPEGEPKYMYKRVYILHCAYIFV